MSASSAAAEWLPDVLSEADGAIGPKPAPPGLGLPEIRVNGRELRELLR